MRNCLYCHHVVLTTQSGVARGDGKFCSRRCASKYAYENGITKLIDYLGNKESNTNLREEDKVCIVCGRNYKARHFNRGHQRYCSNKCRYISNGRKLKNKDELISLYKDGHSINELWRKFKIPEMALEYLLIENGVKIRTGQEQRMLMRSMGRGNWHKKVMAQCKICGNPFYPKLNKRYCSVKCMCKDPERREMLRRAAFKQMQMYKQHSDTIIERKIKEFLINNNIKFEHQYRLGNWSYDFFIPPKILIEVDGDYWHANPKIFKKLNTTQLRNLHNDKVKKTFAIQNGYILIRIWEDDIKNKWQEVEDKLSMVRENV